MVYFIIFVFSITASMQNDAPVSCSYWLDTPPEFMPPECADKKVTHSQIKRRSSFSATMVAVEQDGEVFFKLKEGNNNAD